ncbi:MAG: cobalt ECF transporter T component CbiQ [Desulfuromonadales bacterium GWD2_61_12]|nr:MAG: cobalt ECF transporter T component CbiQ [Desulfuromonadales bacterium GWD2_61_12]OGR33465.1 MAG: cobalt ECF transporter T component CbiQ [Desulfuromonadales bacterium GWC2_61_20]HAD05269.1 cobalt ECF transporter T component CbiQ [Desulfuromonas sp.]HBT83429.1 cobalt ECF transporter T component CbiQ [Desulfuromonas sp.]
MSGHHTFIDKEESGNLLVALDGRVKLLLLVAALGVNLSAGGLRVPPLLASFSLLLVLAAGVRPAEFARRMLVPALLAAVAFITQLFWVRDGAVVAVVPLFFTALNVHGGGLLRGLELAGRILGGMGVLLCFSLTTPLPELMRGARFFRCPPVLVELALIMYRYVFLLMEEGGRIRNAQKARLGFVDFRTGLRSSGNLGGMLVLRSYDRAERSFAAMRCRGYTGALVALPPGPLQRRDWLLLLAGLALLAGLLAIR